MDRAAYGLAEFVADLRAALRAKAPEAERLEAGAAALQRWLSNSDALADYRHALEAGRGPWLLYADPDLGFVVTLLRKTAGVSTPIHHHGEAWTLYGIADGQELIHRYERVLCAIDGTLGGVIAYQLLIRPERSFAQNAIAVLFGMVLGAGWGVVNYEIVSKRLLKVVPVRALP